MPLYEYQCEGCGSEVERLRRIADHKIPFPCNCGSNFNQVIKSAPFGQVQPNAEYICPVTGKQITSWRQRRNVMAEHDLIDANEVDQEYAKRNRLKKKEKRDKLAKEYLPPELRDKLKKMGQEGKEPLDRFHIG